MMLALRRRTVLPLVVGGLIYILARPDGLLVSTWLDWLGLTWPVGVNLAAASAISSM